MPEANLVYIGMGANIGQPRAQVLQACAWLDAMAQTQLVARSSLYATPPWGVTDQPPFINAVAALKTRLEPHALLRALKSLERRAGRQLHGQRWGPRPLDLDILTYGAHTCADAELTIPHPYLAQRAFVLLPLAELAPDLVIPGKDRVQDLLPQVDATGCVRLPDDGKSPA